MLSSEYDYPWWLAVVFVVSLIVSEYVIYVIYFLRHMLFSSNYVEFGFFTVIFHVSYVFLWISYYKCVKISPGCVPVHINEIYPNIEEIKEKAQRELELRVDFHRKHRRNQEIAGALPWDITQDSYCFKCNRVKPARAHHCKECKSCVLRMDHHCVWVGNCVGLQNQKYFILFLFYATFCLLMIVCSIFWNYFFEDFNIKEIIGESDKMFVTVNCASSLAIALAVGYLFAFQVYCIKKNITTIEFHYDCMKGALNPFNKKNFKENAIEIFGNDVLLWGIPCSPFKKKGYSNEMQLFKAYTANNNNIV